MIKVLDEISLPESWVWRVLGDLGVIVSGGTPSTHEPQFWDGNIAWITPADLSGYQDKFISRGKRTITQLGLDYSSAVLLPSGSLMFSSRAPIGYVAIARCEIATNQGFKNLIPLQSTFIDYIYYYLKSAKQLVESMARGTTFLELSGAQFSKIPIPIPPLEEQKRIVEKIEELFSDLDNADRNLYDSLKRIDIYKEILLQRAFETDYGYSESEVAGEVVLEQIRQNKLSNYIKSVDEWKQDLKEWQEKGRNSADRPVRPTKIKPFLSTNRRDLVGLPNIPVSYQWVRLGNVAFVTKLAGFEFSKIIRYEPDGNVPVIKAQNVTQNGFEEGGFSFVHDHLLTKLPRIKLAGGEILFVLVGAGLGNVGIVPEGKQYLLGPNVGMIRVEDGIFNKYVQYFLMTISARKNILDLTRATAQGSISLENVRNLLIPLCSYQRQIEVVARLENALTIQENLKNTVEETMRRVSALRQSILKTAFRGELTSQNENDQPAIRYLAQLKIEKDAYVSQRRIIKKSKPNRIKLMNDSRTLVEIIADSKDPIPVYDVWKRSLYKDDIEAFYDELRQIQDQIDIVVQGKESFISIVQ